VKPTAEQMRDFARRDWSARARTKVPGMSDPAEALELSDMLWRHMRQVDPRWPDAAQRGLDLQHHVRLEALKRRISDVLFAR
jgi:hypothetical protein